MNILFIPSGVIKSGGHRSDAGDAGIQRISDGRGRDTGRCDRDQYLLFCPRCQRGEYSEHSGDGRI